MQHFKRFFLIKFQTIFDKDEIVKKLLAGD